MKTIKVRIPVAVDEGGKWCAYGFDGHEVNSLSDLFEMGVGEDMGGGERLYFVEAKLLVPEPLTVQGNVTATVEPK